MSPADIRTQSQPRAKHWWRLSLGSRSLSSSASPVGSDQPSPADPEVELKPVAEPLEPAPKGIPHPNGGRAGSGTSACLQPAWTRANREDGLSRSPNRYHPLARSLLPVPTLGTDTRSPHHISPAPLLGGQKTQLREAKKSQPVLMQDGHGTCRDGTPESVSLEKETSCRSTDLNLCLEPETPPYSTAPSGAITPDSSSVSLSSPDTSPLSWPNLVEKGTGGHRDTIGRDPYGYFSFKSDLDASFSHHLSDTASCPNTPAHPDRLSFLQIFSTDFPLLPNPPQRAPKTKGRSISTPKAYSHFHQHLPVLPHTQLPPVQASRSSRGAPALDTHTRPARIAGSGPKERSLASHPRPLYDLGDTLGEIERQGQNGPARPRLSRSAYISAGLFNGSGKEPEGRSVTGPPKPRTLKHKRPLSLPPFIAEFNLDIFLPTRSTKNPDPPINNLTGYESPDPHSKEGCGTTSYAGSQMDNMCPALGSTDSCDISLSSFDSLSVYIPGNEDEKTTPSSPQNGPETPPPGSRARKLTLTGAATNTSPSVMPSPETARRMDEIRGRIRPQVQQIVGQYMQLHLAESDKTYPTPTRSRSSSSTSTSIPHIEHLPATTLPAQTARLFENPKSRPDDDDIDTLDFERCLGLNTKKDIANASRSGTVNRLGQVLQAVEEDECETSEQGDPAETSDNSSLQPTIDFKKTKNEVRVPVRTCSPRLGEDEDGSALPPPNVVRHRKNKNESSKKSVFTPTSISISSSLDKSWFGRWRTSPNSRHAKSAANSSTIDPLSEKSDRAQSSVHPTAQPGSILGQSNPSGYRNSTQPTSDGLLFEQEQGADRVSGVASANPAPIAFLESPSSNSLALPSVNCQDIDFNGSQRQTGISVGRVGLERGSPFIKRSASSSSSSTQTVKFASLPISVSSPRPSPGVTTSSTTARSSSAASMHSIRPGISINPHCSLQTAESDAMSSSTSHSGVSGRSVASILSGRSLSRVSTPATPFSPTATSFTITTERSESKSSRLTPTSGFSSRQSATAGRMSSLSSRHVSEDSYDLLTPPQVIHAPTSLGHPHLAAAAIRLLSSPHIEEMLSQPAALERFTAFIAKSRPESLPLLVYFLDATKALRAIGYANAIADALDPLEGLEFTREPPEVTINAVLEKKAKAALEALAAQDLPAYVTEVLVGRVSAAARHRISGTPGKAPGTRHRRSDLESQSIIESFCLTDPSQAGNPIVFASEEFYRISQHNPHYVIGRSPGFLQGPATSSISSKRFSDAIKAGNGHTEVIVNYRRDGTAFPNLVVVSPLTDNHGTIRYYIGAQVDVSNFIRLEGDMLGEDEEKEDPTEEELNGNTPRVIHSRQKSKAPTVQEEPDEFRDLCEMFNAAEIETVRDCGGRMHRKLVGRPSSSKSAQQIDSQSSTTLVQTSFPVSTSPTPSSHTGLSVPSNISGPASGMETDNIFKSFLLVRPAPSLRIIFTSAALRLPGLVQSSLLSRIGGSARVRAELEAALTEGRSVTAKVRWLTSANPTGSATPASPLGTATEGKGDEGGSKASKSRPGHVRWIHCTPLLDAVGDVGVWMVMLVDEPGVKAMMSRFRQPPPVASDLRSASRAAARSGSQMSLNDPPSQAGPWPLGV